MEGRCRVLLVGGVLLGLAGCSRPFLRSGPDSRSDGPLLGAASSSSDKVDDKAPLKPETVLAMAEVKLSSARDPGKSSRDRDALLEDARKGYQQVLQRQPNNPAAVAGLAKSYAEHGDRQQALEVYQKATRAHPKDAALWYEMGVCQGQMQDWDGAIASFTEATQVEPDNRTYRTWLGFTLARVGRVEEGFAQLKKGRSEPEAHYLLAKVLMQTGNEPASRQQLAMALHVDADYAPAAEMMAALAPAAAPAPQPAVQAVRYDMPLPPQAATPAPRPQPAATPAPRPQPVAPAAPRPAAPAQAVAKPSIPAEPALLSSQKGSPMPTPAANDGPAPLPPPVLSSGWEK